MDAGNIFRSSSTYIGKLRSNFLGTKFVIYDTQPAHASFPARPPALPPPGRSGRRLSKKASSKLPVSLGSYGIARITYELNVLGTRGPRRMHCVMHSIPSSSLDLGATVSGPPELHSGQLDYSFRSLSFSKSLGRSADIGSASFSETGPADQEDERAKALPLVLKNKVPRWHELLQCWCLNFRGRVTVASVKNFQLIAAGGRPVVTAGGGGGAAGQQWIRTRLFCSLVRWERICSQWIIGTHCQLFRRLRCV